jgi:hypothetical protein
MWVTRTLLEEREQQLVARVQQLDGSARDEVRAPGRGRAASVGACGARARCSACL